MRRPFWRSTRPILHEEALQAAGRFIAGHFRSADQEYPRIAIPARPDQDDDLVLLSYILQQAETDAARLGLTLPEETTYGL